MKVVGGLASGKYVRPCNHRGTPINDPVLLKPADDLYRFSIADGDIWVWVWVWFRVGAVAPERGLDVAVSKPDVSPLALQGPKAEAGVAPMPGDRVRGLKYFWFREPGTEEIPVAVKRSG